MDGQQSCSQRKLQFPLKKIEIEKLIERDINAEEEIHFIKQFVSEVLDFSSQYGSDTSISYTAYNLTGKPSKFPDYGDFPQAFVMKTYGNWWKEVPSYSPEYMSQNTSKVLSHDYVVFNLVTFGQPRYLYEACGADTTIHSSIPQRMASMTTVNAPFLAKTISCVNIEVAFEQRVYPFTVSIYETYNPGSVVRIWAKNDAPVKKKWSLLWEGEPMNVGHVPRIFSPIIEIINFKTSVLRIEFNHSKLEYYTGLDAVLLVGTEKPIRANVNSSIKFLNANTDGNSEASSPVILEKLSQQVIKSNLHNIPRNKLDLQAIVAEYQKKNDSFEVTKGEHNLNGSFQCLPNETILKILGYLDFSSLRCCARVNKYFLSLCNDHFLYVRLSLKPLWSRMHDGALFSLSKMCKYLQRLDLSWCGSYSMITTGGFVRFVTSCCHNLTHIRLNCCKFVTSWVLEVIAETCPRLKEVALRNCCDITEAGFNCLSLINNLENLDLYRTNITINSLIPILQANRNMRHLNIGSCTKISNMDGVAIALATYNKKLISIDFCKTSTLTQVGVAALSECTFLEEIDFGWCLGFTLPIDSLAALACGCPRLKKLFLTAVRGIADKDLEPFIRHCPNLEQIDLLGVRGITPDICFRLLTGLPKLRLLDLSFCDMITDANVSNWKCAFPNVSIKRSFQTEVSSNFLYQHSIQ